MLKKIGKILQVVFVVLLCCVSCYFFKESRDTHKELNKWHKRAEVCVTIKSEVQDKNKELEEKVTEYEEQVKQLQQEIETLKKK